MTGITDITLEQLLAASLAKTSDPRLTINLPDQKLPVGQHRFSLAVTDDSGNSSTPTIISLTVTDTEAPRAVIDLRNESGVPAPAGRVRFGEGFILDGARSTDSGFPV